MTNESSISQEDKHGLAKKEVPFSASSDVGSKVEFGVIPDQVTVKEINFQQFVDIGLKVLIIILLGVLIRRSNSHGKV